MKRSIDRHFRSRGLAAAAALGACCALAQAQPRTPGPQVMGWVPAYGIEAATRALETNAGIGPALTRLGLQFWNPSVDGRGVVFAPVDANGKPINPADVVRLQRWAHAHGVQTLLTIYNNSPVINRWDWPLARRAFADHPEEFIAALLATVDSHGLDGVDLDFEGEGDFSADRATYASFVRQLSDALKTHGKLLTIDSFHSPCDNAPNMSWWADWAGHVAAIHSMGYSDLYEGSTEAGTPEGRAVCESGAAVFRYSWQLEYGQRAGYRRDQIVLGMPTWVDHWGSGGLGSSIADHLHEVRSLGGGVGLRDMQLAAPGWNRPATWEAVQALHRPPALAARHGPGASVRTARENASPTASFSAFVSSRSTWTAGTSAVNNAK